MKKTSITFMALALSAAVGLAQDKPAAAPAAPAGNADPVIMSAPGVQVHKSEFEAALKSLPAEYQQFAQGPGKRQFADDYIRMKLLAAQGMAAGLDKDPDVQSQLALLKETPRSRSATPTCRATTRRTRTTTSRSRPVTSSSRSRAARPRRPARKS